MMKKAIFFWCALLPLLAAAQSYPTRFFTGKALNVVQVGGDSTRLDVSFNFLDETGRYDGGDVREGDVLYVSDGLNGLAFEIDSVLSPGFTSVTVRVNKQAGLPGIPSGSGLVSRGTPVYSFMPFTSGSFQENQVLTEDFVWRVDSLLQVVGVSTNLSFSGASSPVTLNSSTGDDVTVTAGAGISLSATSGNLTVTNTGDLSNTNEIQRLDTFAVVSGVLRASLLNDGVPFSSVTLPVADGSETKVNAGTAISVSGTGTTGSPYVVANTAPDQTVSITNGGGIGVSGTYPAFTLTATDLSATNELQNLSLSGQSLGISGGTGVTLPIVGVTAGTGISVSTSSGNATVANTGDLSNTNEIQRLDTFAVVSGVLRASLLNDGVPFSSVTLPVADGSETKVNAGTAISVSGTGTTGSPYVVANTAPDQTVSITNGGGIGVSGTYPAFTLTATDLSATNELQNLSLSGQSLGISGGTGVTLPIVGVTAGTGISVSTSSGNATVTNTGDLSETNELQTLSVATNTTTLSNSGGSMTIAGAGINSVGTSGSTITVTGTEVDGSTSNELQNLSLSGQALGISSGTGVTLPIVGVTAGTGISVSTSLGSATVTNTGDTNAADDITGSGAANQFAYFSGTQTIASSSGFTKSGNNMVIGPSGGDHVEIIPGTSEISLFNAGTVDARIKADDAGKIGTNVGLAVTGNSAVTGRLTVSDRLGAGVVTPRGTLTVSGPSGDDMLMGDREIMFLGGGIANNSIKNNHGGAKGLWVGNVDCCDALGSSFSPYLKIGGLSESEFFQHLKVPTIQITGSAADGRVLQSNATGVAAWVDQWRKDGAVSGLWTDVTRVTVGGQSGSKLVVRNPDSGTSAASNGAFEALVLRPHTATDNNWAAISSNSAGGSIAADIAFRNVSHSGANSDIVFHTRSIDDGSFTHRFWVKSNGKIGVNTDTPAQLFHVQGTARITGSDGTGTTIMARDADGDVSAAGLSGLSMLSGTLTAADGSATNELQNLSLSGQALGISSGTGVTLPIIGVTAGTGISVSTSSGNVTVTNTGDTNAADDLTGSAAAGQVAFWNGSTVLAGENALWWDSADKELGIGTVPTASLHIVKGSVSSWSPMTVQGDVSGNMISTVWNENNSGGGGNNLFDLTVGGVNGGDPAYRLRSNGESESWVMALDNDAGNQFVIGNESLPGQGSDFFTITATGNTGIMNNAPGNTLSVGGTGAIEFPNGTTAQRPSATVPLLRHNSTVNGIEVKSTSGHWTRITSAATPTVSAGAGAGTGATVTLLTSANDLFGTIDLTTGSSPTAGGTVLTLTFNQSFSSSPRVSVSLECRNDNCLTQRNNFRVSAVGSASFQIVAKGGTSLPASTSIQLDYQIHN